MAYFLLSSSQVFFFLSCTEEIHFETGYELSILTCRHISCDKQMDGDKQVPLSAKSVYVFTPKAETLCYILLQVEFIVFFYSL